MALILYARKAMQSLKSARAMSSYVQPGRHRVATMNDLPIPKGPWNEAYNANQMFYNITLLGSTILLGVSLIVAKQKLILWGYTGPEWKEDGYVGGWEEPPEEPSGEDEE